MPNDNLSITYSLKDHYSAKLKTIKSNTASFGQQVGQTNQALAQMGRGAAGGSFGGFSQGLQSLGGIFKTLLSNMNPVTLGFAALFSVFVGGAVAIGGLLVGLTAITFALKPIFEQAVAVALNMERLTYTFIALGNSAAEAKAKMAWIKTFAQTSIGEFKDLAEAATLLEATGLRAEHFIPVISMMAGAFGGTREQILEIASALGRVPSGVFGETMEVLRRFGIGAADLINEGIKITKGGEIQAEVEEMLTAIENIAQRKFGGIATIMGATLGVKMSNLADGWNAALAALGEGFLPVVKKIVDAITPALAFMATQAKAIGLQFSNMVSSLYSDLGGESFVSNLTSYILAIMTNLPALMGQAIDAVKMTFNAFTSSIESVVNLLGRGLVAVMNNVNQTVWDVKYSIAQLLDAYDYANNMRKNPIKTALAGMGSEHVNALPTRPEDKWKNVTFGNIVSTLATITTGGAWNDIAKSAADYRKKFGDFKNQPGATASPVGDKFNSNYMAAAGLKAQQETAENTKILADDYKAFALGGGDRAKMGITRAEWGGARRAGVDLRVSGNAERGFISYIESLFARASEQLARQGG